MSDGDIGKTSGRPSAPRAPKPKVVPDLKPVTPEPPQTADTAPAPKPMSPRDKIIEATMELAAEREWNDFSLSDVAERAGLSLADFRDAFPSKGAVLAGFSRKIDRIVLDGTDVELRDEAPKERLFDVLIRRLDAMTPYKMGLESVSDWVRRDPMAAAALNGVATNSMRFMLEAAGIDTEKGAGAIKIQGLVIAWARVLGVWFKDTDPGIAKTMAALDKELRRGETLSARADDVERLTSPLRLIARRIMRAGQSRGSEASAAVDDAADPALH